MCGLDRRSRPTRQRSRRCANEDKYGHWSSIMAVFWQIFVSFVFVLGLLITPVFFVTSMLVAASPRICRHLPLCLKMKKTTFSFHSVPVSPPDDDFLKLLKCPITGEDLQYESSTRSLKAVKDDKIIGYSFTANGVPNLRAQNAKLSDVRQSAEWFRLQLETAHSKCVEDEGLNISYPDTKTRVAT